MLTIHEAMMRQIERIKDMKQNPADYEGFPVGLPWLDEKMGGLPREPRYLGVIAPAKSGKTTFLLHLAKMLALVHKQRVHFASLEESAEEIAMRLLASGVDGNAYVSRSIVRKPRLITKEDVQNLEWTAKQYENVPMTISDNVNTLEGLFKIMQTEGAKWLFLDYFSLFRMSGLPSGLSKAQELDAMSKYLVQMKIGLGISIVSAFQQNLTTGDAKGTRSVPDDADLVMVIKQPEDELNQRANLRVFDVEFMVNRIGVSGDGGRVYALFEYGAILPSAPSFE